MKHEATVELHELVGLFFPDQAELGDFQEAVSGELPTPARALLSHDDHMTETMEAFHGCPVLVDVLSSRYREPHYMRKILLRRSSDREVVMYGLVRLNFRYLDPEVRRDIESERIPLGRTLIEHNVMRKIQLVDLWRITTGEELARHFDLRHGDTLYGRTALIYCNGEPAVELLEIVPPANTPSD